MNHTTTARVTHDSLVAHWVEVTDLRGRTRLEMRWVPAEAPAPAPAGSHRHAA